jgi:23S rRNA pseudouridine1911/1915/1917 synthase
MSRDDLNREVPPELAKKSLDGAVRALFETTWGEARSLIERGKVSIDGKVTVIATARVRCGQILRVDPRAADPRKARNRLASEDAIVFADAHVVVVKKPAGISTVPFEPGERGTLDELVRAHLVKRGRGDVRPNLGVVHRLDKETTGLVVFTRTWLAKKSLSTQFRFHTVHRKYVAFVHGHPRSGTIRSHLVEDRGDGLRGSIERQGRKPRANEGQLAITHVEVKKQFVDAAWVECTLETGRTHQIRIHLAEAGHPILGERVYIRGFRGHELPAPRVMLHAAELGFIHPATEQEVSFAEPMPDDMKQVLATLAR